MAYPPAYVRAYSFTDWETTHPGEPKPGNQLDAEYDAVSNALTGTQDALALIQRADGALANDSVGEDQLQDGLLDGIVDGVTADAEAAAAAAAASASAAAGSAAAADASAVDVAAQVAIAAGHAASAGVSQGIAQGAATAAAASADEAGMAADVSITAATSTENSVAQAQLHEEMAFKWAEYLAAPVMPAPPGWPEAVDDGMFSAKWWALRARDYNEVHEYDFGTAGTNPGEAFDIWDLTNDLEDPPGLVYMTWGTPPRTYVLTDPSNPSDPNSWMDITGADGPPGPIGPIGPAGPPNTLTIGTVTTGAPGSPADATITGTAPNQVLNMTIPAGADGAGTTLVAASGTIGLTAVAGAATTAARSDSTPPLSQAIAPTWTARHTFTLNGAGSDAAIYLNATANPFIGFNNAGAAADNRLWDFGLNGTHLLLRTGNDANSASSSILDVNRAGNAVASITLGNATSNPAYNFLGSGTATFNGTVDLLGPLRATGVDGVAGQVLSTQGAGLPPVWRTSSGGSIELGYNFSTSVGTANPGSQKLSLNSAVYASVTVAVFNALAMTNFDANTILSLLTTGNRIYIQQRNDASKAVVYEVTGPGTNMTGYWTIPVTLIQSRGAIFSANADLNVVFILSVSSTSLANPTALVGLTAVNGSATTGMRSDAAPALDLSINPSWTGVHQFVGQGGYFGLRIVGADPAFLFYDNDAPLNEKLTGIEARGSSTAWQFLDDGAAAARNIIRATRGGAAVTNVSFGNATDNPAFNFLGTGLATFGGAVTATGALTSSAAVFALDGAVTTKIQSVSSTSSGLVGTQSNHALEIRTNNFIRATWGAAGGLSLAGATSGNMGAGTINATGLYVNGVAVSTGAGTSGANPSASVGLAAVNGAAATFMRSDAAPALDVSIAPTWTGLHTWSGAAPELRLSETDQPAHSRMWRQVVLTGTLTFQIADDAAGTLRNWLAVYRSASAVSILEFGNTTNNPAYSFLGTGGTTFSGGVVLGAPTGGNKGVGTLNATALYINNVAVTAGGATGANPSTTIGLTAVNGSAGTFLRSDGAPALSQAIVPTWTGGHTFATPITLNHPTAGQASGLFFQLAAVATGRLIAEGTAGSTLTGTAAGDITLAISGAANGLIVGTLATNRLMLSMKPTVMSFGNATDNPAFNFLGTGSTVFGGRVFFPDGIAAVPSITFTNDTDCGFNRLIANSFSALAGGSAVCTFYNSSGTLGVMITNGTVASPGLSFMSDSNTGFLCGGAGDLRASVSGTQVWASSNSLFTFNVAVSGPSFTSTSSRAIKRETGKPSFARDILARLRPLLYRLLAGDDREQLGLIAEEVQEVCPQLSDGKSVAYDRLAILLLAAWQEEHLEAA